MKNFFKKFSIFLLLLVLICALCAVVACTNKENKPNGPSGGSDEVQYTITVQRSSGQPFSNATVLLYPKNDNRPYFATTDVNGVAVIKAPKGEYDVRFTNTEEGYKEDDGYTISDAEPEKCFKLEAELIKTPATKDTYYTLGKVMHDFSFTDIFGMDFSLSDLLKQYKAVVLNFWYIGCYWCDYEFPDMKSAYYSYAEDVAVLAMHTNSQESKEQVIQYATTTMELPFIVVDSGEGTPGALFNAFGFNGNPATVVIDRQGVVCFASAGAQDEGMFIELFRRYSAEPYNPFIYFPDAVTDEKPNVEAPAVEDVANTLNSGDINATYSFIDDEYNWPWIIEEDYVKTSNSGKHSSFSILDAKINASSTQCIAFDYKLLTESGNDVFYVYANNVLIHEYSGMVNDWKTCYAYVPITNNEECNLTLAYTKDSSRGPDGDYVAIKNVRILPVGGIGERTEIIYRAATGANDGTRYSNYITPVYNAQDGYYHVGSENGPLLLADLMNQDTAWSNTPAWNYVETARLIYDIDGDGIEEDYTDEFTLFAQVANSSPRYGFLGVTEDLKTNLRALTAKYSGAHENEWLELCSYVIVYGAGDEVLGDPAVGLAYYNSFEAKVSESEDNQVLNNVVKTRVIMPRGIYYKFVPNETAVYRINSVGYNDTICFILNSKLQEIMQNDDNDDADNIDDAGNFMIKGLFEKDTAYYILVDFNMVEDIGTFDFVINKLATKGNVWVHSSGADYRTVLDDDGNLVDVVLGGAVDYVLGEDNVYHVKNKDGSVGSKIYIDMIGFTYMFPYSSIKDAVDMTCYYCKSCGYKYYGSVEYFETQENPLCSACLFSGKNNFEKRAMFSLPTAVRDENGYIRVVAFEHVDDNGNSSYFYVPMYELNTDEVVDYTDPTKYLQDLAVYGIKFTDYTDTISHYIELSETKGYYPEETEVDGPASHVGFVEANKELVDILMKYIVFGNYSISYSIENAWLMLAHNYKYLG